MKNIVDPQGRAVQSAPKNVGSATVPSPEMNLKPEEIAKLDYQPLGNWVLIEPVMPETKTKTGIHVDPNMKRAPLYRILREGSGDYKGQLAKYVGLGDVVYTSAPTSLRVFHTYPRVTLDPGNPEKKVPPVIEERYVLMLNHGQIEGFVPGYRWSDEEIERSKRKVGTTMVDFEQSFIDAIRSEMATAEEAEQIDFVSLSDRIIVERVPPKSQHGSFFIPEVQDKLPFFRILKFPVDMDVIPPHLRHLKIGDVVLMNGVHETMEYPTGLKDRDGKDRKTFIAPSGTILGYWPSLHWDHAKPQECISISDTSTASD